MRSVPALTLLVALVLSNSIAQSKSSVPKLEYLSPDGELVAAIIPAGTSWPRGEICLEVRTRTGETLAKSDYSSDDGEHGYGVAYAKWTPDSMFFVYSLENVGGHSPWHTPVEFFSRKKSKTFSLDDLLKDAISDPRFSVASPDEVRVELHFKHQIKTVSLSSLVARL